MGARGPRNQGQKVSVGRRRAGCDEGKLRRQRTGAANASRSVSGRSHSARSIRYGRERLGVGERLVWPAPKGERGESLRTNKGNGAGCARRFLERRSERPARCK